MNKSISQISLDLLAKQIERDLLDVVKPFIGDPVEGGTIEKISEHCTRHLEEFYGSYYDKQQYALRVNVTPSDTNKTAYTLGWRLCERSEIGSKSEGC